MDYSVGIIGGSDGPTAVFVTSAFSWELLLLIVAAAAAVGLILYRKNKNKKK